LGGRIGFIISEEIKGSRNEVWSTNTAFALTVRYKQVSRPLRKTPVV
jgi:hypothetical protein